MKGEKLTGAASPPEDVKKKLEKVKELGGTICFQVDGKKYDVTAGINGATEFKP